MNPLTLQNFTLTYSGEQPVFAPLSFTLQPGEAVALGGESGAGKSSLLHSVCGLVPGSIPAKTEGELLLFGRPPADYNHAERTALVGMVFQTAETQLFCGTVELEVAFGLENLCMPRAQMQTRVRESLEQVGLWERRTESPSRLSGGQKQLLALAAALALRPRLLLLDEALSQLDEQACARMMDVLLSLKRAGQTMLFVDHDEARRRALADREVLL